MTTKAEVETILKKITVDMFVYEVTGYRYDTRNKHIEEGAMVRFRGMRTGIDNSPMEEDELSFYLNDKQAVEKLQQMSREGVVKVRVTVEPINTTS